MPITAEDLKLRQQAISEGKTTYYRGDGTRYTIRNLGNKRHSANYGGQGGRDERSGSRKGNRGSGTGSRRERNERLSTPPGTDRRAFGNAMADANARGLEGHHATPVYLTGNALADMTEGRRLQYYQRYRDAGVPIGNDAQNVIPLGELEHDEAHREGDAVQDALKRMGFSNGSANLNTILTKANMPALGGFKQDNRQPTTTATSKPEQPASKPVQQPYRPPQLPVTPVMDLAKPVMTFMGAAAAITTSLMGFDLQFK